MSKEFQIRDGNLIASFDLENEDGDIDFCKLLKVSHGVADEIGMFVDYVATNKIIKDQSKQIADLEAKLAESEEKKESYRLQNEQHHLQLLQFYSRLGVEAFGADIHEKALETLMIMKDQLAEKEKEIESLKHFKVTIGTMETNQVDISSTTYIDQDKISFALEQLEKVREFCEKELKECDKLLKTEFEDDFYIQSVMARESMCFDFRRTIDSQIKQLKGKK